MKKNTYGTSIAEAMVVLVIVVTGVVGMYEILIKSQRFSKEIGNRIIATQIAREGIEAVINMRDTNALLFAGDLDNCWNTMNYNTACIWSNNATYDIWHAGHYRVFKDTDNRWKLENPMGAPFIDMVVIFPTIAQGYSSSIYRQAYGVQVDSNGLYTQNGGTLSFPVVRGTNMKPYFTRRLYITYIDTNGDGSTNESDEKMRVSSIVHWGERNTSHNVTIETTLSNWKGN